MVQQNVVQNKSCKTSVNSAVEERFLQEAEFTVPGFKPRVLSIFLSSTHDYLQADEVSPSPANDACLPHPAITFPGSKREQDAGGHAFIQEHKGQ